MAGFDHKQSVVDSKSGRFSMEGTITLASNRERCGLRGRAD